MLREPEARDRAELGVRWHRRADSLGEDQPDPDRSRALFYLVVHPEAVTLASMFACPTGNPSVERSPSTATRPQKPHSFATKSNDDSVCDLSACT